MAKSSKPAKPRPDFPLFPHATGRWAKKIRGKLHYFGKWDNPQAALERYVEQRDDLYAGRTPRAKREGLTVKDACDRFLHARQARVESKELSPETWDGYRRTCRVLVEVFGPGRLVSDLTPEDFGTLRKAIGERHNLVSTRNQITVIRSVFKWALNQRLLDKPILFGDEFAVPSAAAIRRQRVPKMFAAAEVRLILERATPDVKAAALLGLNGGLGATDLVRLPKCAVDLKRGWVDFPRVKTGVERRFPLWPESVVAIQEWLGICPPGVDLMFADSAGKPLGRRILTARFSKLLHSLGISRPRVGHYALRHAFETVGGQSCDQIAVDAIMGHQRSDMGTHYREYVSDDRLLKVVNTVHAWLFSEPASDETDEPATIKFRTVG